MRALILALFAISAPALAANEFHGVDDNGRNCSAQVSDGKIYFQTGTAYSFLNIPFKKSNEGLSFDIVTIDRGGSNYSPPNGEKPKFGNLGLIRITGVIQVNEEGRAFSYEVRAVGGIGNWWRTTFRCNLPEAN